MPEPLEHFGVQMVWEPVNYDEDFVVHTLKYQDSALHVQLEPGDATRYDLLVMWARELDEALVHMTWEQLCKHLIVIVSRNGDVQTVALYGPNNFGAEKKLWPDNEWSQQFLKWWLDILLEKLNA